MKQDKSKNVKHECDCEQHTCSCGDECMCGDECTCGDHCNCTEEHNCGCGCCHEQNDVSHDALGYLEIAQRIQADFENYKKRNADIAEKSYNMGVYDFVEKLLPALDSFKQARETVKDPTALAGLNLIHGQIIKALESFGIKKIECVGQEFNPNYHNAVLTDCNPDFENDIITEEFQEGFKSVTKVIRHSVVKINKI